MQAPVGLVAAFSLEFRSIGIRLVDIAGLHRQKFLLCGHTIRILNFGDKVHQLYRVAAADVVYFVRNAVWALFRDRHVVERMHAALGDVIDVGEVANHVAVVEHLDGLALRDGAGKEHGAHVGAFPAKAGAGSRGIKLRPHAAIFPPRGPSAFDERPSRPFGLRFLTQNNEFIRSQKSYTVLLGKD